MALSTSHGVTKLPETTHIRRNAQCTSVPIAQYLYILLLCLEPTSHGITAQCLKPNSQPFHSPNVLRMTYSHVCVRHSLQTNVRYGHRSFNMTLLFRNDQPRRQAYWTVPFNDSHEISTKIQSLDSLCELPIMSRLSCRTANRDYQTTTTNSNILVVIM